MKLNDKKSGNGVFSTQSFLPAWETSLHPSSQALSCPSPHALWSFALVFQPQISGSLNLLSGFFFQPSQLSSCFFGLWVSCWAVDSAGSLSPHALSWASLWPPRVGVRGTQSQKAFSLFSSWQHFIHPSGLCSNVTSWEPFSTSLSRFSSLGFHSILLIPLCLYYYLYVYMVAFSPWLWTPWGQEPCLIHLAWCQLQNKVSKVLVKCYFSYSSPNSHVPIYPSFTLYQIRMHLAASNKEPDYSALNRDFFFSHTKRSLEVSNLVLSETQLLSFYPASFNVLVIKWLLYLQALHISSKEEEAGRTKSQIYPFSSGKNKFSQKTSAYMSLARMMSHDHTYLQGKLRRGRKGRKWWSTGMNKNILGPYPRPTEWEMLGLGPRNLCCNRPSKGFWFTWGWRTIVIFNGEYSDRKQIPD